MKTVKTLIIALLIIAVTPLTAQTADEIINNYFETTGGKANWGNLKGLKISGSVNAQGMEIPVDVIQTKDGKQLVTINFQGQEIKQMAFDGETLWTTNMMTMQPEKSDAEMNQNMKQQAKKDFPSPFFNYKEKGYTVEAMGKETIEGTETYKLKLTKEPMMVDGEEVPNVTYYFFETENFVPIATQSEVQQGPMKGQTMTNSMSDYQEVDGLYFPFDMGISGQSLKVKEITLNPETNESMFAFPE